MALDIVLLNIFVKKKALSTAFRLMRTANYKPGDLIGHLEILHEVQELKVDITVLDVMSKTLKFIALSSSLLWTTKRFKIKRDRLEEGAHVCIIYTWVQN